MIRSHQPTHPPSRTRKRLARRTHRNGAIPHPLETRQSHVLVVVKRKTVVHLVGNHKNIVLDTKLGDLSQLLGLVNTLPTGLCGVLRMSAFVDGFRENALEVRHVERPFVGIDVCVFRIRGRQEGHVERHAAVEEDLCIVLIEKRLDAHHAIAVIDESAHDRVDAPVGAARHLHLGLDIELARSGSTLSARPNAVAFASSRGEVELGRVKSLMA